MKSSSSSRRYFLFACGCIAAAAVGWRLLAPEAVQTPASVSAEGGGQLPRNVVVFETDDQRWDSLTRQLPLDNEFVMPNVHEFFVENGTSFANAFVTNPTCCPSRASQLAGGFYSHHTGVLTNTWPNGGAPRFNDENALAVRLKDAGLDHPYYTVLIGKYMNGYGDLVVENKKSRYIPPKWDLFIVASDSKDWDRDYEITIGSNGDGSVAAKGFRLPKDICEIRDPNTDECEDSNNGDNWRNGTLEAALLAQGVPDEVVTVLKEEFPFVVLEENRPWTYLPELEYLLAKAALQSLPDPLEQPLFMMVTMAPPHGPTQLDSGLIDCDGDGEPTEGFTYDDRAYGEGSPDWDDISDKPSWMQGNPASFVKHEECKKALLNCFRGDGCLSIDCSDNEACDRDA